MFSWQIMNFKGLNGICHLVNQRTSIEGTTKTGIKNRTQIRCKRKQELFREINYVYGFRRNFLSNFLNKFTLLSNSVINKNPKTLQN